MGVSFSIFVEPDLNNTVSCITFLVPEIVYCEYFELHEDVQELKSFLEQFSLAR